MPSPRSSAARAASRRTKRAADGFERTTLSPGDREKIAHGNAERILKIRA
jgi:hypothetical protein